MISATCELSRAGKTPRETAAGPHLCTALTFVLSGEWRVDLESGERGADASGCLDGIQAAWTAAWASREALETAEGGGGRWRRKAWRLAAGLDYVAREKIVGKGVMFNAAKNAECPSLLIQLQPQKYDEPVELRTLQGNKVKFQEAGVTLYFLTESFHSPIQTHTCRTAKTTLEAISVGEKRQIANNKMCGRQATPARLSWGLTPSSPLAAACCAQAARRR